LCHRHFLVQLNPCAIKVFIPLHRLQAVLQARCG
jgi:hypothetical protein